MATIVRVGPEYFPDPTKGRPVSSGSIYIGDPDTDPEVVGNQIQVSALQENGNTVEISQPISTSAGGVSLYNGSPVTLSVQEESYSMKVLDSSDAQVYYVPSNIVDSNIDDALIVDHKTDHTHIVYSSIAELRAATLTPFDGQKVSIIGYAAAGDSRDGDFYWDASSTDTDDGGAVIKVTTITTGRWKRLRINTVDVSWFGALGDGANDDTEEIQAAIDFAESETGRKVFLPPGTYKITAALVISELGLIFEGSGSEQTIISNVTNDVIAIHIDGSAVRADRVRLRDFRILHEAATKFAVVFDDSPYSLMENVLIDCNFAGYGGVLWGDELATPASGAFLGGMYNCRVESHTTYGVRVNSTGNTWTFRDCWVGSTSAGAVAGYFNKEMCHVDGGQWGGNSVGGIGIYFYNASAADAYGGSVRNIQMENVQSGEYGIVVSGNTRSFVDIQLENIGGNFNLSIAGTLVRFDMAKNCKLTNPIIDNPTSGGTLINMSSNSEDCIVECTDENATAPMGIANAAIRAEKRVKGIVLHSVVGNITTAIGITTNLVDGVVELPPGFNAVHNGTAWNYEIRTLADDEAFFHVPPSNFGTMRILNTRQVSTMGSASYDVVTPGCEILAGGTDFEATTGVLNGTTGTNLKDTVSASSNGAVYVEARKGAESIVLLFEPTVYGP